MIRMNGNDEKYPVGWEENLFSIYCDLHRTAREWMLSGTGIHLDDIVDCIDVVDAAGEIADEDKIKAYPLVESHYRKIKDTVSDIRDCYQSYMSKEKIGGNDIKKMMDDVRELLGIMQRGIGRIQHMNGEIEDVGGRMELRDVTKRLNDARKVVKHFNDSFSQIKEIEWNAGYSKTHVRIVPKSRSAYHPFNSKLVDVEIRGDTEIDITVSGDSIEVEAKGGFFISFFAFGKIPDMYVENITIDRNRGVEIAGGGKRIIIEVEYGELKISISGKK